jgi:hypothetical protein
VYRVEALRDQPPELDAQAAGDVSAVERVKTVLVDRDEALHKARVKDQMATREGGE